jgi:hypothetical protein
MKKKISLAGTLALTIFVFASFGLTALAADPDFGGVSQFRDKWVQQDHLVGVPGINRPYTWGPNVPGAPVVLSEPYNSSPGGQRRVLYLDKARMEINNPANGFVTTGLAVKELVSGMRQDGDNTFTPLAPSQTQVAGDPVVVNPNAPVYASFKNVVTLGNADANSKPSAIGATINNFIDKAGSVSTGAPPENITIGAYQAQTGHNIAAPFEAFKNIQGPITNPATNATINNQPVYTTDPTSNVFGLAISEPYWVSTKIAGVNRIVLVQLFERRVLTYNPALPTNKVEMGNLGQHYYQWRYVETATPTTANFAGNWNTNIAKVALNQTGATVTGSYILHGEATATALNGTVTGNILNGYYGGNPANLIKFTLDAGGNSFSGTWGGGNQWCGVKSGALPAGCGFSGTWYTNFATVNLTQNGSTVSGNYTWYGGGYSTTINGTVKGTGGVPILTGYYAGVPSNSLFFPLNNSGSSFDGSWLSTHQWCGVRSGALPAGCGWSGKWNLGGAGTVANLIQTGNSVTGTYVNVSNGTVSGTVSAWTLTGTWFINSTSGPFKWTQVGQGLLPQKFQGNYNTTFAWCGYRDGTSAPTPCLAS